MMFYPDIDGNFDLSPLFKKEIWSVTFIVWNATGKTLERKIVIREQDALASTLFDFSLRCKSIDYMDYDWRSLHLAIAVVDDKSGNTNITPGLVETLTKLNMGLF